MLKKLISKKRLSLTFCFLALAVFIGIFLRIYQLKDNLFFSYEQGRDLLAVKSILEGDIKLLGPRTSIEGLFHGPFYYYLMAPFFLIFSGNPLLIMTPFIFFSIACILLIFLIGRNLFSSKVGLLSAFIFSLSYGLVVYGRWLSHPPLAIFFTLLYFYFLIRLINGEKKIFPFVVFAYGGIIQTEIVAGLFLLPTSLLLLGITKAKIGRKDAFLGALAALFVFSPYLIFEIKHKFILSQSLLRFLTSKQEFYHPSFSQALIIALNRYFDEYRLIIFPSSKILSFILQAGSLMAILIQFFKKQIKIKKISLLVLFFWLISAPVFGIFLWGGLHLKHYMVSVAPAMALATGLFFGWLINLFKSNKLLILALIFFFLTNLTTSVNWLRQNREIFYFATQPSSAYGIEKQIISQMFESDCGKKFSYRAFTIPYESEHAWEYLFWWYGKTQYNYQPAHISGAKGCFFAIFEPGGDAQYRLLWRQKNIGQRIISDTYQVGGIGLEKYNF